MGRQRSKKLKSVDPYYLGPKEDVRDAHKHNLKPADPDDQPAPNKVKLLFAGLSHNKKTKTSTDILETYTQSDMIRKRSAGGKESASDDGRGKRDTGFKRAKGESNRQFLERVDRETNDEMVEHYKKSKQKSEKKKLYAARRKEKAHWKKKGESVEGLKEVYEDRVKFGEVVQEPPQLTSKPRKAAKSSKTQKALSLRFVQDNPAIQSSLGSTKQSGVPCKTKTKTIEDQRRQQELEIERQRVVEVYRMKKKMKTSQTNQT